MVRNKKSWALVLIFLILLSSLMFFVSALNDKGGASSEDDEDENSLGNSFLDALQQSPFSSGVLNSVGWLSKYIGDNYRQIILSFIVFAIICFALYDILELVSIFQHAAVKAIISLGIGISVVLTKGVVTISGHILSWGGEAGIWIILLEVFVSLAIFFGLIIGNDFAAKFAQKRQAAVHSIKAKKAASDTRDVIQGLRTIGTSFQEDEKTYRV
jgi:hypothetical protein